MTDPAAQPLRLSLDYAPMRYSDVFTEFQPVQHTWRDPHYYKFLPHYYTKLIDAAGVKSARACGTGSSQSTGTKECFEIYQ